MTAPTLPRYPVYIPSKGRAGRCLTAHCLVEDGVPFHLVIEAEERAAYAATFGEDRLLILPFSNQGLIAARNWIKAHAIATGAARHWQLDDNMRAFYRRYKANRMYCAAGLALRAVEDFTDRYENIAIAGMNYTAFLPEGQSYPPFTLNQHVYSCSLVLNSLPHRWRSRYNDDTDMCLQVLADGWCTVLFNAFCAEKTATMTITGGNTTDLYQGDGRLKMARALERLWPGVVTTSRRYHRPQHIVKNAWCSFDTPLKRRPDVDFTALAATPNDYGMILVQKAPIRSPYLRALTQDMLPPTSQPAPSQPLPSPVLAPSSPSPNPHDTE